MVVSKKRGVYRKFGGGKKRLSKQRMNRKKSVSKSRKNRKTIRRVMRSKRRLSSKRRKTRKQKGGSTPKPKLPTKARFLHPPVDKLTRGADAKGPSVHPKMKDLVNQDYYFGVFSDDELRPHLTENGNFLVRDSAKNRGTYILMMYHNGVIREFKIVKNTKGMYTFFGEDNVRFQSDNIPDLINLYVRLRKPLNGVLVGALELAKSDIIAGLAVAELLTEDGEEVILSKPISYLATEGNYGSSNKL